MARKNKTRDGTIAQKKSVCLATIPFVEADILGAGSVFVEMPKRSFITRIFISVLTASGTASSTIDALANSNFITLNLPVTIITVAEGVLINIYRYLETGGELVIKAGTTPPADGALVGELIVEYYELDKNTGEYTSYLNS